MTKLYVKGKLITADTMSISRIMELEELDFDLNLLNSFLYFSAQLLAVTFLKRQHYCYIIQ